MIIWRGSARAGTDQCFICLGFQLVLLCRKTSLYSMIPSLMTQATEMKGLPILKVPIEKIFIQPILHMGLIMNLALIILGTIWLVFPTRWFSAVITSQLLMR